TDDFELFDQAEVPPPQQTGKDEMELNGDVRNGEKETTEVADIHEAREQAQGVRYDW
ncbi:hypothetical protein FRX31_009883, partial [Thalictrum thalictroides]